MELVRTLNTHQWITSFLLGRTQRLAVKGLYSDFVSVVSGVQQGSVLRPLLYLLFISDLPDKIISKTCLFADDCIVYRPVTNLLPVIVSSCIKTLMLWQNGNPSGAWSSWHPLKCSVLSVLKSRSPSGTPTS